MITRTSNSSRNIGELQAITAVMPPHITSSEEAAAALLELFARRISGRCQNLSTGVVACLEFDPRCRKDIACWVGVQLTKAKTLGCGMPIPIDNLEALAWTIVKRRFGNVLRTAQRKVGGAEFKSLDILANQDGRPDRRLNNKPIPRRRTQVASGSEFGEELVALVLEIAPTALIGRNWMRSTTLVKCILRLGWAVQLHLGKESEVYREFVDGLGRDIGSIAGLSDADRSAMTTGLMQLDALCNHRADFKAAGLKPPDREAWKRFIQLCGHSHWLRNSKYSSLAFNESEDESDYG